MDTVSLSTTEAEFKGISEAAKKVVWLKNVMKFLEMKHEKIEMFNDNRGAIKIAHSASSCGRTRHIALRYFFLRELIKNEEIGLSHIEGKRNVADTFTKSLGRHKFVEFNKLLLK